MRPPAELLLHGELRLQPHNGAPCWWIEADGASVTLRVPRWRDCWTVARMTWRWRKSFSWLRRRSRCRFRLRVGGRG